MTGSPETLETTPIGAKLAVWSESPKRPEVKELSPDVGKPPRYLLVGRHYSPVGILRFVSVDPSVSSADAADQQTWNRYTYVENNPVAYLDPSGRFKIKGEYSHRNVTKAGLPASGGLFNRKDVISGNRNADLFRKPSDTPNHLNKGAAEPGSADDTRVVHGTAKLGEVLGKVARGDLQGAGKAMGNALHSFDDVISHGNATGGKGGDHSSPENKGDMDSAQSPGIETRFQAAAALEGAIASIIEKAAAEIKAGGDPAAVKEQALREVRAAVKSAYDNTKRSLEKQGTKPKGY